MSIKKQDTNDAFYSADGRVIAVSVFRASVDFGVSTRRVRQMLLDGSLKGSKNGQVWRIDHPYIVRIGSRGPVSNASKTRSYSGKRRWNTIKQDEHLPKKGDRKSFIA